MEITEKLYVADRKSWRRWLQKNHAKKKELWLVYYNKASGKPRIPYNDAVEEALCFGWIDSIVKKVDDESFAQRFSPRKPTSILSQMNRERLIKLVAEKKMTPAGLKAVAHVFHESHRPEEVKLRKDTERAIKKNPLAWKYYQQLPERYKRIRIAYIEEIRPYSSEGYRKRLAHFIRKTAQNKRFGFVRD
jgi:uncharacterized protein YdeI (YjbR/CyaY-like superfamily)